MSIELKRISPGDGLATRPRHQADPENDVEKLPSRHRYICGLSSPLGVDGFASEILIRKPLVEPLTAYWHSTPPNL